MSDVVNLAVMVAVNGYAGGVFWWMSRIGRDGDPESSNMLVGIKTTATTASPKHWGVAHRAASKSCQATGVALVLSGVVALTVGLTQTAGLGVWVGGVGLLLGMLVGGGISSFVAHQAAKKL